MEFIPNKIQCKRNLGKYLVNATNGTFTNLPCKCYGCEDCCHYAKYRLQKALSHYLSQFKNLYFWTFTFRSSIFKDQKHQHHLAPQIWREFTLLLRKYLQTVNLQEDFKYIKVLELHKSGYIHYHVVFERYLWAGKVRELWQTAIKKYVVSSISPGNVHAKRIKHANQAANYLAKYVVKAAKVVKQTLKRRTRLYSKSNNVILFANGSSTDIWYFENLKNWASNLEIHRISVLIERNLELKMEVIEQSCYKKYLFDLEIEPIREFDYYLEH